MPKTLIVLCVVCAAAAVGCGSLAKPRDTSEYQTVAKDPHRDTETARRVNVEAVQLMAKRRFDQAEKVLKNALTADTLYGPAHNNLGKVYYHQKRYYLAAWEFQYAIKLMPHQPEPLNNLGLVYENVGKLADAQTAYGDAMKLTPDDPVIMGNLARAKIRSGERTPEVRELLEQLVMREQRPDWAEWARREAAMIANDRAVPANSPTTQPD